MGSTEKRHPLEMPFLFGGKALVEGFKNWLVQGRRAVLKKGGLCGCLFCLGGKALVEGFKNWLVQGRRAVLDSFSDEWPSLSLQSCHLLGLQ